VESWKRIRIAATIDEKNEIVEDESGRRAQTIEKETLDPRQKINER
jgi:hypothetical protein